MPLLSGDIINETVYPHTLQEAVWGLGEDDVVDPFLEEPVADWLPMPSVPGTYWRHKQGDDKAKSVNVWSGMQDNRLFWNFNSFDDGAYSKFLVESGDVLWHGPLIPPPLPVDVVEKGHER